MSEEKLSADFRLAHTMMRVKSTDRSLEFYCGILGMQVLRRTDYPEENSPTPSSATARKQSFQLWN